MMTIGVVSKITGVSDDRIRIYGKEKLIEEITNPKTKYRYYNMDHIHQINFIAHLQKVGLKIKEIKLIMDFTNRDYNVSLEEHLFKIAEILNKYDSSNNTDEVHKILDDLIMKAYNLSEEELKIVTTPFATIEDEDLRKNMYVNTAEHYISKYIIELDLDPQEAYKYFSIALDNKIKNENRKSK